MNFMLRKDGMPWGNYCGETLGDVAAKVLVDFKHKNLSVTFISEHTAFFISDSTNKYTLSDDVNEFIAPQ